MYIICVIILAALTDIWAMPSVNESELRVNDTLRSKRRPPPEYYDFLHKLIDKHADCADQHLTPLPPHGSYKPFETFVYPNGFTRPQPQVAVANGGSKCKHMKMCPMEQQGNTHRDSGYNTDILKFLTRPKEVKPIYTNYRDRAELPYTRNPTYQEVPMYGRNYYKFGNNPGTFRLQFQRPVSGRARNNNVATSLIGTQFNGGFKGISKTGGEKNTFTTSVERTKFNEGLTTSVDRSKFNEGLKGASKTSNERNNHGTLLDRSKLKEGLTTSVERTKFNEELTTSVDRSKFNEGLQAISKTSNERNNQGVLLDRSKFNQGIFQKGGKRTNSTASEERKTVNKDLKGSSNINLQNIKMSKNNTKTNIKEITGKRTEFQTNIMGTDIIIKSIPEKVTIQNCTCPNLNTTKPNSLKIEDRATNLEDVLNLIMQELKSILNNMDNKVLDENSSAALNNKELLIIIEKLKALKSSIQNESTISSKEAGTTKHSITTELRITTEPTTGINKDKLKALESSSKNKSNKTFSETGTTRGTITTDSGVLGETSTKIITKDNDTNLQPSEGLQEIVVKSSGKAFNGNVTEEKLTVSKMKENIKQNAKVETIAKDSDVDHLKTVNSSDFEVETLVKDSFLNEMKIQNNTVGITEVNLKINSTNSPDMSKIKQEIQNLTNQTENSNKNTSELQTPKEKGLPNKPKVQSNSKILPTNNGIPDNDIVGIDGGTALELNITNSQDLAKITDEMQNLVKILTNETIEEIHHDETEIKQEDLNKQQKSQNEVASFSNFSEMSKVGSMADNKTNNQIVVSNRNTDTEIGIDGGPAVELNITNSQDLAKVTDEIQNLVKILTNETIEETKIKQEKFNKQLKFQNQNEVGSFATFSEISKTSANKTNSQILVTNQNTDTEIGIDGGPALELNITNSQDLAKVTDEIQNLVKILTNETIEEIHHDETKIKQQKFQNRNEIASFANFSEMSKVDSIADNKTRSQILVTNLNTDTEIGIDEAPSLKQNIANSQDFEKVTEERQNFVKNLTNETIEEIHHNKTKLKQENLNKQQKSQNEVGSFATFSEMSKVDSIAGNKNNSQNLVFDRNTNLENHNKNDAEISHQTTFDKLNSFETFAILNALSEAESIHGNHEDSLNSANENLSVEPLEINNSPGNILNKTVIASLQLGEENLSVEPLELSKHPDVILKKTVVASLQRNSNTSSLIEQQSSESDSNSVEISGKDSANLGVPNTKAGAIDMAGTGSRFIKFLKKPKQRASSITSDESYVEPIFSEIYPAQIPRRKIKMPLNIYMHRIEEKYPSSNSNKPGVHRGTFETDFYNNNDILNISKEECEDEEDSSESQQQHNPKIQS